MIWSCWLSVDYLLLCFVIAVAVLPYQCPVAPALFVEKAIFPPLNCFFTFVINQLVIFVDVYFWIIYSVSFIFVSLFLCQYYTALITVTTCLEIKKADSLHYIIFFQNCLEILVPMSFHLNFKIILSISTKKLSEILIRVPLNLYIDLGRINTFIIFVESFSPQIPMSLHLFRLYWLPLSTLSSFQHISTVHVLLGLHLRIFCV